jgi:hypothetical protein
VDCGLRGLGAGSPAVGVVEIRFHDHTISLRGAASIPVDEAVPECPGLLDPELLLHLSRAVAARAPWSIELLQQMDLDCRVLQGLHIIRNDVSSLVDVVKGIQYSYREMLGIFKADHEAVIRLVEVVEKMVDKE